MLDPPLACLNKSNRDLWRYEISRTMNGSSGTEAVISARFISPENHVNHIFSIWVNLEKYEIGRIEFAYQWNIDHPVAIRNQHNRSSSLKNMSGTILFHHRQPVYLDTEYQIEVCDAMSKKDCDTQKVYYELKMRNIAGAGAINSRLYSKIANGLSCDENLSD